MEKTYFVASEGKSLTWDEVVGMYNFYTGMMMSACNGQIPAQADGSAYDGGYNVDLVNALPPENAGFLGGWYHKLFGIWLENDMMFKGSFHALTYKHRDFNENMLAPAFYRVNPFAMGAKVGYAYETVSRDLASKEVSAPKQPKQQKPVNVKPVETKPTEKPKAEEKPKAAAFSNNNGVPFGIAEDKGGSLCQKILNNNNPAPVNPSNVNIFPGLNGNPVQNPGQPSLPPEVLQKMQEREANINKVQNLLNKLKQTSVGSGVENPALAYMNGDPQIAQEVANATAALAQQGQQIQQQVPVQQQPQQPAATAMQPPVPVTDLHYTMDQNLGKFASIMHNKGIDPNIILNKIRQTLGKPQFKSGVYEISGLMTASFRFMFIESIEKFGIVTDAGTGYDLKVTFDGARGNMAVMPKRPRRQNNDRQHHQAPTTGSNAQQQAAPQQQQQGTINPEFIRAN